MKASSYLKGSMIYQKKLGVGEILGINRSFNEHSKILGSLNIFIEMVKDSFSNVKVAFIPFKEVLYLDDHIKAPILEKIINMSSAEASYHLSELLKKISYSSEEYFLYYLKGYKDDKFILVNLAKALRIGVRTLQRIVKKYKKKGFLEKRGSHIFITIEFKEYLKSIKEKEC